MLYGISLLAACWVRRTLPTMAVAWPNCLQPANLEQAASAPTRTWCLALGGLMVMVGLAFKLSAVPFHFWCPDVFEGATRRGERFPVGRLEGRRAGAVGPRGDRLWLHAGAGPELRWPNQPSRSAFYECGRCEPTLPSPAAERAWNRPSPPPLHSRATGRDACGRWLCATAQPRGPDRGLEPARTFCGASWRSWRSSPARSATWRPMARRTSSGCWPIRRSPRPAT